MKKTIIATIMILMPTLAMGTMYKCSNGGSISFQDTPCGSETGVHRVNLGWKVYATCDNKRHADDMRSFSENASGIKMRQYFNLGYCEKHDVANEEANAEKKRRKLAADKAWKEKFFQKKWSFEAKLKQQRIKAFHQALLKLGGDSLECSKNLICWGKRNEKAATRVCKPAISLYAKNNYKWLGEPFSKYGKKEGEPAIVVYLGNNVEFVNGFGAWFRYMYSCEYNTITGEHKAAVAKGVL